jgi:hypothetical protein
MSRVMSFATAHNALRQRHRELMPRFYQPFWFDRQREFHPGEPSTFSAPLFIRDGERLHARLSLHQIRGGYALRGGTMDNETTAAVEAIREVFADERCSSSSACRPATSSTSPTARSATAAPSSTTREAERRRLLIRLWLRTTRPQVGYTGLSLAPTRAASISTMRRCSSLKEYGKPMGNGAAGQPGPLPMWQAPGSPDSALPIQLGELVAVERARQS